MFFGADTAMNSRRLPEITQWPVVRKTGIGATNSAHAGEHPLNWMNEMKGAGSTMPQGIGTTGSPKPLPPIDTS